MTTKQMVEIESIVLNLEDYYIDAHHNDSNIVLVATATQNQTTTDANYILAALVAKGYETTTIQFVTTTRQFR